MDRRNFLMLGGVIGSIVGLIVAFIQINYELMHQDNFASFFNFTTYDNKIFIIISLILLINLTVFIFIATWFSSWFHYKLYPGTVMPFEHNAALKQPIVNTAPDTDSVKNMPKQAETESKETEQALKEVAEPISSIQAALLQEQNTVKKEFESKVTDATFEDPDVIVKNPGQKLTETPAALFSKYPYENPEKPQLDDESFSRKNLDRTPPRPV